MGRYKRQTLIFDPAKYTEHITIVGLGNAGSHIALTLTRLGITGFILYDLDKVEDHNLSSQAYIEADIGLYKGIAIFHKMKSINSNVNVLVNNHKFNGEDLSIGDILIIAVDTMKERKRLCEKMIKNEVRLSLIIDSRMGGGQLEIYSCNSLKEWQKTFVDNPSDDPCGGRFICYVSAIVGALVTNQVKKFLKQEEYQKSIMINVDSLQVATNFKW